MRITASWFRSFGSTEYKYVARSSAPIGERRSDRPIYRFCHRHAGKEHSAKIMRCVLGLLLGCTLHDREPHLGTDRLLAGARALAPVLEQALDATIHVGFLPAPNRRLRYPSLALDAIRAEPATRQQHNACACNDFLRRLAISDEPLQCRPVTGPDVQACIDVSHAAVQSDLQALGNPINGSEH